MTREQAWRLFLKTGLPEAYLLARSRRAEPEGRKGTAGGERHGAER